MFNPAEALIGSPPRMWGKVKELPEAVLDLRITPTYVGKRLSKTA